MSLTFQASPNGLRPSFRANLVACVDPLPDDWVAYRTVPGPGVQAALNAAYVAHPDTAPEAAPAGESAHEFGEATDLAHRVNGELTWDYPDPATGHVGDPAWQRLWTAVRASAGLHSGMDFPPVAPADPDHVEDYGWAHATSAGPSMIAQLRASGRWGVDPNPAVIPESDA